MKIKWMLFGKYEMDLIDKYIESAMYHLLLEKTRDKFYHFILARINILIANIIGFTINDDTPYEERMRRIIRLYEIEAH